MHKKNRQICYIFLNFWAGRRTMPTRAVRFSPGATSGVPPRPGSSFAVALPGLLHIRFRLRALPLPSAKGIPSGPTAGECKTKNGNSNAHYPLQFQTAFALALRHTTVKESLGTVPHGITTRKTTHTISPDGNERR
jgi:hypothetical protein